MTKLAYFLDEKAFYGRRQGRPLRINQREASALLLPKLLLSPTSPPPVCLSNLFSTKVKKIYLEIGFGGGEHILHRLTENPNIAFIGIEPFVNGMNKLLTAIEQKEKLQQRLRVYNEDASNLLNWFPSEQFSGIYLLYPDPWPKKRHWKRRFINQKRLNQFSRLLIPGGFFRFASDSESYINWTLSHIKQHPHFCWDIKKPQDCYQSYPGWISTRYEKKALKEGRQPHYFNFIRSCYLSNNMI